MAIRGQIDGLDQGVLYGWIDDPDSEDPIQIDVAINDTIIAKEVSAGLFRDDLLEAGIGGGYRGFCVEAVAPSDGGDVVFSVYLDGQNEAVLSRVFHLNPTVGRLGLLGNGMIEGYCIRKPEDISGQAFSVEIRLNDILLLSAQALPSDDDNCRAPFQINLTNLENRVRRQVLRLIDEVSGQDSSDLVLTLHRVAGRQVSEAEAHYILAGQELLAFREQLDAIEQRKFHNAVLLRKALEASGLWGGKPLQDSDLVTAKQDPTVLCLDLGCLPVELQNDDPIKTLAQFRALSVEYNLTPNQLFSETWYRRHRKDVAQALISGAARSGLDHFLSRGLDAGYGPHEGINVNASTSAVRELLEWLISGGTPDMPQEIHFTQPENGSWKDFSEKLRHRKTHATLDRVELLDDDLQNKDWVLINSNTHTRNIHITRAILDDARGLFGAARVHMASYDNVVAICAELEKPVLLCIDGQTLNTAVLEKATRYCAVTALWTFDDPYNLNSHLKIMDLFDLVFSNDQSCLSSYGDKGFYLPLAAPASLLETPEVPEASFDIFFCGTAWPNRITLINRLMQDRPSLRFKIAMTYNAAVPPLPIDAPVSSYVQSLSFADYIRYARRSRITLSLHRSFSGTDEFASSSNPGPRVFEIGAAGAYQISENGGEGFESLFSRDELAYYDSYEELLVLVDSAIANSDTRKAAADDLRKNIAARHTYRHRLTTIAEELARLDVTVPPVEEVAVTSRPRLLYVVHNTIKEPSFGGLEVHQDILSQNLKDRYEIFFFYTVPDGSGKRQAILTDYNYKELVRSQRSFNIGHANLQNPEIEKFFSEILSGYDFDLVHFFHFINNVPSLAHISRSHGVPYGISFHDFYTGCREFNLLDHNRRYCQNDHTRLGDCDICLRKRFKFPAKSQQVRRDYFGDILARADTLMFVSKSTQIIHEGIYPQIALAGARRVHGAPIPNSQWSLARASRISKQVENRRLRFVVLGNFSEHKGAGYLLDALTVCPTLDAEFHFHGGVPGDIQKRYNEALGERAIFHGKYAPGDVDLRHYDFSLHLSIWPETYCQTLSEAWAAGIVPIVTDIGALGQRVLHGVNGYKANPERPATLATLLMEIVADPEIHLALRTEISDALFLDQPQHAQLYHEAYSEVLCRRGARPVCAKGARNQIVTDGATVEVLQRRRRTPFWNQGKGGHPKTHEYLPHQGHLDFKGRFEAFSGKITYAEYGCFDSAEGVEPIVLKNMDEISVRGWVDNSGLKQPRPVAMLSTETGIYLFPLAVHKRPDVAKLFSEDTSENWGVNGNIRLLTPDMMLTGPVELGIGWHDLSANILRICPSTIQIMGKFGA